MNVTTNNQTISMRYQYDHLKTCEISYQLHPFRLYHSSETLNFVSQEIINVEYIRWQNICKLFTSQSFIESNLDQIDSFRLNNIVMNIEIPEFGVLIRWIRKFKVPNFGFIKVANYKSTIDVDRDVDGI